jgi:hypothetical protein
MGVKSPLEPLLALNNLEVPASSSPLVGLFRNPNDDTAPNSISVELEDRGILGSLAPGPRIAGALLNNAL